MFHFYFKIKTFEIPYIEFSVVYGLREDLGFAGTPSGTAAGTAAIVVVAIVVVVELNDAVDVDEDVVLIVSLNLIVQFVQ